MNFVKTHLILLICGAATLLFIVLGVLGMMSNRVIERMQERAAISGQIAAERSKATNDACIDAQATRAKRFQTEYDETVKVATHINARKPLLDGVFPAPAEEGLKYGFRQEYRKAMTELPRGKLMAGDRPGQRDIEEAYQDIVDMVARLSERKEDSAGAGGKPKGAGDAPAPTLAGGGAKGAPAPAGLTVAGAGGAVAVPAGGRAAGPGGSGISLAGAGPGGNLTVPGAPPDDPKFIPAWRATVTKARSIRCYLDENALQVSQTVNDSTTAPTMRDLWYAQVGLWIQQDVINGIAELNDEVARQLTEPACVENVPIKRIEAIRVLGYWLGTGSVGGGGGEAQLAASWTQRKCDKDFDIVRFNVSLVVDQRELTRAANAIVRQNFYKLIGVPSCRLVTAADKDEQDGYLYGAAPVVRVTFEFEASMARNAYEKLYPAEVREDLGIK